MRILILGATGRIGRLVVDRGLADGHDIIAVVRDAASLPAAPRLSVVVGGADDERLLGQALVGAHAVVSALGPRANRLEDERALEGAMRSLVRVMDATGVRRLVALSGAGITVPGEHKPAVDRVVSVVVRRFARHVVGAKQREFDVFSASALDWTAVRPPLVTDGAGSAYRLSLELTPGARVTRAATAAAMVDLVSSPTFLRAAPFVLPPER